MLYGLKGRGNQQRRAAHRVLLDYISLFVDNRIDFHIALDQSLPRQSWILGRGCINFPRGFHLSSKAQWSDRNGRGWYGLRRSNQTRSAKDATQHAADWAVGNSAWYAAENSRNDIGGSFR